MTDKSPLADRILARRVSAPEDDPTGCDDHGSFGMPRGGKERSVMLDFRLKGGNSVAVAYALLEQVSYDPSEGITLRFFGVTVKLRGRNFSQPVGSHASLLDGLHRHRVV